MTNITKWAFKNKAAVIFAVILILAMGTVNYFTIPMELMPVADSPQITVSTMANGMDAKTMQNSVTEPIEKAVGSVKGKKNVYSTTGNGFSQVSLRYESKTNMKEAKQELQETLASVNLPEGASKPYVLLLNTSMIPVAEVSLMLKDGAPADAAKKAEDEIMPLFKSIKGVGNIQIAGGASQQVVIKPNPGLMAQFKIPPQALFGVMQGKNVAVPVAEKTIDGKASNLKVTGEIADAEAIRNIQIAPNVPLKAVAIVELQKDEKSIARLNGKTFIDLVVTKDATSNAVAIGKEVEKTIEKVNKEYGAYFEATMLINLSESISDSVHSMTKEVLMGALFATIVILVFLRSFKITFISIVSIPLSLCLTVYLLAQSGITLNILTLGGIAVAVGRLVDDSIVVVENIFRRAKQEPLSMEMIVDSVKEVAAAITASTLTTVAVFMPIGLMGGGLQDIVLPFALTVTYSLLSSLVVAITVVPLMSARLLKSVRQEEERKQPKAYIKLLTWSLNHKWAPIGLSIAVIAGSVGLFMSMPKGSIDQSDSMMVSVSLKYPDNAPYEKVKDGALKLEKFVMEQPEGEHTVLQLGNSEAGAKWGKLSAPTTATIIVMLKKDADAVHLLEQIRGQKANFTEAEITADGAGFGGGGGSTLDVDLMGNKAEDLNKAAKEVTDALKAIEGVKKVESNQDSLKTAYEIAVTSPAVNAQDVASGLRAALNPVPIGSVKLSGKDTPVVIEAAKNPAAEADIAKLEVMTATGPVQLSQVAKVTKTEQQTNLLRKDGHNYIRLTAQLDPKKAIDANQTAAMKLQTMKFADGVTFSVGGSSAQSQDDLASMAQTMVVSIGIVFLIMVITFKTFRAPIAILVSLPLAAMGALLGLVATNTSIDPTAAIGMLMLIGIVVTNAIVLIDRVKQNEEKMIIRDAIVEAGSVRLRPILMTAIATVCAMLPLAFGKAESASLVSKGLAVVVIGGLTLSTLLTLVIVPVVYELLYFKKSKRQRKSKELAARLPEKLDLI